MFLIGQLKNPAWFLIDNKENLDASGLYGFVLIGLIFFFGGVGGGGVEEVASHAEVFRGRLGELVFHPSPQMPAQLRTTFLSQKVDLDHRET